MKPGTRAWVGRWKFADPGAGVLRLLRVRRDNSRGRFGVASGLAAVH